jgi:ribosomal protein L22
MTTLKELLQQKEAEYRELGKVVEALRIADQQMDKQAEINRVTPNGHGNIDRSREPKLSQAAMARAVLADARHEMHVKEIADLIKTRFDVEIKPSYLAPVIYRQLSRVFFKGSQPNTFGLIEWQKMPIEEA